ncbi:MAG: serine hydrolase [Lachnospiraceae bacterium]|nr:serine hydrolase [Lachnospiraceae bacterium]
MFFKTVTPEEAGISSGKVVEFLKILDSYNFCTHSIIMARGDKIFAEVYYKPFDKNFKHRMYSISKSFVSVALGMAAEEGLLSLSDKMIEYFPEYVPDDANELMRETTIRDMLTMETSIQNHVFWFTSGTKDRTEMYFKNKGEKVPGTIFCYDSPGSYMLGVIVEKVTGKPFLEYMKEKALCDIGFSADAYCLTVPGGHSFGDSGIMCTARDLLTFARFVMNKGEWCGKQYMDRNYLEDAVKKQVSNANTSQVTYNSYGYGYQIWKAPNDGFAFIGMGDQFAICDPDSDFIFIINSDNQGSKPSTRAILYHELYKSIIGSLSAPMPKDEKAYADLVQYCENAELFSLKQEKNNPFEAEINGKVYELKENRMKIEYIKFNFEGKKGILTYKNEQGTKELVFGLGYNEFGKVPQEGYSDMTATEYAAGNYYDCACSADWTEEKKLRIKVQIIDKYFGNASFVFSFKDSRVSVLMTRAAENFLLEYEGVATGNIKN